jgi:hypothetical protein
VKTFRRARRTDVVDDHPAVAEAAVRAPEEGLPVREVRNVARRARGVAQPVAVVDDGVAEAQDPREVARLCGGDAKDGEGGGGKEVRGQNARCNRHHRQSSSARRRPGEAWSLDGSKKPNQFGRHFY